MQKLRPYLQIARFDHWMKNVFVLPGVCLAIYFSRLTLSWPMLGQIVLSLIAAGLIASSNYVINEILDAPQDKCHPEKMNRPIPSGHVYIPLAWFEWALLAVAGLLLGFAINTGIGFSALALWVMGLIYNVRPLRFKELPYLDVLTESVNNPIRLAMGWYATSLGSAPPLSVVMAYWMFGSFLMAVKRLAEYRMIADPERATRYRNSFAYYNDERLLVSIMFYACLFSLTSGVFIARYRIELALATPLVALCMAYYIHIGFKPNSAVQHPERLFTEPKLMIMVIGTFSLCAALLFIELPGFVHLFEPWIVPPTVK